ncbi:MAG: hypothetical protein E7313_00875 [Clostridiales bacterium]|nr:hypothetical protein [Clostridiales bacterium]
MKFIKKMIIVTLAILSVVMLLNKSNAANVNDEKQLERGEKGYYCIQKWDGSKWVYLTYNRTYYTDTNNKKYIAYCLSPGLPGVGYVSGEKETYSVKIKNILDNEQIWRVIKNGYPYKTIEELDVETDDDAYFATMQAVNCILRGYTLEETKELYSVGKFAINGENIDDITRRGNKTLNAMYKLIDIGLNGKETRKDLLNISVKEVSDIIEDKDYISKVYEINSNADISEYVIESIDGFTDGTYLTNMNGNRQNKFKGGEQFKIMIPKKEITKDINGKISIKAKQKNYGIYYGCSMVEGFQDYALCNDEYSEVYTYTELNILTNKSKVIITKLDKDTKLPIEGVTFKITTTEGISNKYKTDSKGEIVLANQRPGTIEIQEIETLDNYKLENNTLKINVSYNEIKEIDIVNEQKRGSIKIHKVDKLDNNIKLQDVAFKLVDKTGNLVKEGKTNINGELVFDELFFGDYSLIELATNEQYNILDSEIKIKVCSEDIIDIIVENEKKVVKEEVVEQEKVEVEVEEEVKEEVKEEIEEIVDEVDDVEEKNEIEESDVIEKIEKVEEAEEVIEEVEKIEEMNSIRELPKTGSSKQYVVFIVVCIMCLGIYVLLKK